MARRVEEIMNRELFSVRPSERVDEALGYILALGITGAPVVDDDGRPMGMLSFRDLLGPDGGETARARMSEPVVSVPARATIEEAGRLLAETGYHRLVVVDVTGKAVGVVSALDVVRGLLGMPATHPATFPHYDHETGLSWTDDVPLEMDRVEAAPAGPGVLVLVEGGRGRADRIVWAEATHELRTRLLDLLALPQTHLPRLALVLELPDLRFRAASVDDVDRAERLVSALLHRNGTSPTPAGVL